MTHTNVTPTVFLLASCRAAGGKLLAGYFSTSWEHMHVIFRSHCLLFRMILNREKLSYLCVVLPIIQLTPNLAFGS
jgi:hypothetical protein